MLLSLVYVLVHFTSERGFDSSRLVVLHNFRGGDHIGALQLAQKMERHRESDG